MEQRIHAGQGGLIDALHRREGPRLQRYLLRLLCNPTDAADATQETYLRMLGTLSRAPVDHPSALLFRVATNVARRMRNRRRLEQSLFSEPTDRDPAEVCDGYALPERQVIARQELKRLAAVVAALPPRCREVFLLSRFEGLPNGEIAVRLGISRNMVEKHIVRALLSCRAV